MNTHSAQRIATLLIACALLSPTTRRATAADSPSRPALMNWRHFVVAKSLPGSAWGTGGIAVGDFNRDGSPDIAVSRRETQTAYWFERQDDSTWRRRELGKSEQLNRTLGAAAVDLNLDGWIDVAFWGVWFENPGKAGTAGALWLPHTYDGGGHDVIAADVNRDGHDDLVTYDGHRLAWFDPNRALKRVVVIDGREDHGGLAPRGAGDLNGDGRIDLVIPGLWLENPGKDGGAWLQHRWPHLPVEKASYGTSLRAWVADLNQDGRNDIVYSDCDTGFGHVFWVENRDQGKTWVRHQLPDPPGDVRTGSFHSLAVADLDGDGQLDVFAGEQEDPDTYMTADGLLPMKPPGLKERGVFWCRPGTTGSPPKPFVIQEDNPGWHDAALVDADGDGDPDIISKVWNADGPTYHVDYWRNDGTAR